MKFTALMNGKPFTELEPYLIKTNTGEFTPFKNYESKWRAETGETVVVKLNDGSELEAWPGAKLTATMKDGSTLVITAVTKMLKEARQ